MSKDEKVRLIHKLSDMGIMSMRGAAEAIMEKISISKTTLYRYLGESAK
ncbi:helix-turn-helix domain-containing protein [Oscillospiraceae bacterium MB08-C2-2]|nr:helix-turn-helix domain-containing protein [Oscillospiraceae bacterium MB08-C2-2]